MKPLAAPRNYLVIAAPEFFEGRTELCHPVRSEDARKAGIEIYLVNAKDQLEIRDAVDNIDAKLEENVRLINLHKPIADTREIFTAQMDMQAIRVMLSDRENYQRPIPKILNTVFNLEVSEMVRGKVGNHNAIYLTDDLRLA
jgi:hypothetical protein